MIAYYPATESGGEVSISDYTTKEDGLPMFHVFKRMVNISSEGNTINVKGKERAYQEIMVKIPGVSISDYGTRTIGKIDNDRNSLFFIPLEENLYAFKLLRKRNTVIDDTEVKEWRIGDINELYNVIKE